MPTYALLLQVKESENIASIAPQLGRRWGLKFQCASCNEVSDKFVYVDEADVVEADGGTANSIFSCKFCKKQLSVSVEVKAYGSYDCGPRPQPVAAFVVRGGEPVALHLEDAWEITAAESETKFFEGVNLDEDWVDYDEKGEQSVSVMGVEVSFARVGK